MPAWKRSIERRKEILAFVHRYQGVHGYGPTVLEIKHEIGYKGHCLPENHLDKMVTIYQNDDTSRWEVNSAPRHIELIHPLRTDRAYVPIDIFADIWRRGTASLIAEGAGAGRALDEAKRVAGWWSEQVVENGE